MKTYVRFLMALGLLVPSAAAMGQGSESPFGLGRIFGGSPPPAGDPFTEAGRGPEQNPPISSVPMGRAQTGFTPQPGFTPGAPPNGAPPNGAPPHGAPFNVAPPRLGAPPTAPGANAGRLPPTGGVIQAGGPGTVNPQPYPPTPSGNLQRGKSDALLVDARLRLAEGDWRSATNLVNQAAALGVRYGAADDSPAKVEAMINRHRQLDQIAQQVSRNGGDRTGLQHRQAQLLLEQAEALLKWRRLDAAERMTRTAEQLSRNFNQFEKNPRELYARIAQARNTGGVQQAIYNQTPPAGGSARPFGPPRDSAVVQAQNLQNPNQFQLPAPGGGPGPPPEPVPGGNLTPAMRLFLEAEAALQAMQTNRARQLYLQAEAREGELDPATRDSLRGRLNILGRGVLNQEQRRLDMLRRQASAELANAQRSARQLQATNPFGAMRVLQTAREQVTKAGLDPNSQRALLSRVDHDIRLMDTYIKQNKARLQLEARNRGVKDEMKRERDYKIEVQERLALLVDQYNKLMREQRWHEAEIVAKQAENLAPREQVVQQLKQQSRLIRNLTVGNQIRDRKAQGTILALEAVDAAATPQDDRVPRTFPPEWEALKRRRGPLSMDRRRSAKDIEIEQKLQTPVSLRFEKAPLQEVMDYLARMADVNLHLDPLGLSAEGVGTDTPITINLTQGDISLKSALDLILEPLNLSYVIKNEVLKVTSAHLRDSEVYTITYNVADLVVPIPNFIPTVNMGLGGAIQEGYRQALAGGVGAHPPIAAVASQDGGSTHAQVSNTVLANLAQAGGVPPGLGAPGRPGGGPGGLNGTAQPDFDPIIELIVQTVQPQTWDEVGGPGRVNRFENNLSLVISQTQDVHDEISDLLSQLRRLQDLQVTIEVRFISLNDNFFERIGVDFDFDIDDDIDKPFAVFGQPVLDPPAFGDDPIPNTQDRDHGPSVTVGRQSATAFSADLDIPFRQDSFSLSIPQFGGALAAPGAGATIGFAILSDLEAFFFIEASQGDQRSNVLQAPKVTLFNGQTAIVQDLTITPFVISVTPVVGDFAAAHQPIIAVLNEGTFLSVQGVVSNDRRFVRLTVVPFFSTIGDVDTFTFNQQNTLDADGNIVGQSGTTVQLPSFSFITVTTTVSVPDGGTVLLGGIKRLSEGRNEFGVPILNKVPYVNRLFKNVGIGRDTQSLLMMVTPRIIIQEEEEGLL